MKAPLFTFLIFFLIALFVYFSPQQVLPSLQVQRSFTSPVEENTEFSGNGKVPFLYVQRGFTSPIENIEFSSDGKLLASGGAGITIWEVATGKVLRSIADTSMITDIALSADGKRLAATLVGKDSAAFCKVKCWNVQTRVVEKVFDYSSRYAASVCFSPDGQLIAYASDSIVVRKLKSGKICTKIWIEDASPRNPLRLYFTGDSRYVMYTKEGSIFFYNVRTGQRRVQRAPSGEYYLMLAGGGKYVFCAESNSDSRKNLKLLRVKDQETIGILPGESLWGRVSVSADGKYLSSATNKKVQLWSVEEGTLLKEMSLNTWGCLRPMGIACFSPDHQLMAFSGGYLRDIHLFDIKARKDRKVLHGSASYFSVGVGVRTEKTGKHLVLRSRESLISWNLSDAFARPLKNKEPFDYQFYTHAFHSGQISRHHSGVAAVNFSADGKYLASSGDEGTILLWDMQKGDTIKTLYSGAHTHAMAFTSDSRNLIYAPVREPIVLYDIITDRIIRKFPVDENLIDAIDISADGSYLAAGIDSTIVCWELATGHKQRSFTASHFTRSVSFSPDGQYLASGEFGKVSIWEFRTGRLVAEWQSEGASACFSVKSKYLIYNGSDSKMEIREIKTGKLAGKIYIFGEENHFLITTPEGRFDGSPHVLQRHLQLVEGGEVQPFEPLLHPNYTPGLLVKLLNETSF